MIRLPPEGHPVRDVVDIAYILALTPQSALTLPIIPKARAMARDAFKDLPLGTRMYNLLAIGADDRVLLLGFGPHGGYRVRWNFGRIV